MILSYLLFYPFLYRLNIRLKLWVGFLTILISGAAVSMNTIAYLQLFNVEYSHFLPEPISLFGSRWWIIPVIIIYFGLMIILFRDFSKKLSLL